MFFEPALFGVTGATIRISELGERLDYMAIAVGILVVTGLVRILVTGFIAFGDNLNLKEKVRTDLAKQKTQQQQQYVQISSHHHAKQCSISRYFARWHAWLKQPFRRLWVQLF